MTQLQTILDKAPADQLGFVTLDGQEVSFGRARSAIMAFAGALHDLDLAQGAQILIKTENPTTDFFLTLACLGRGLCPILAGDTATLKKNNVRLDHIIALSDAAQGTIPFTQHWFENPPQPLDATTGQVIAASSGTTGNLKFFRLSHHVLLNRAAIFRKIYASHDISLSNRPHMITLGANAIYAVLMSIGNLMDGRASLRPAQSPADSLALLAKYDAAHLSTTPLYLSRMLDAPRPKLNLELVVSNGAKTNRDLAIDAESKLGAPVYSSYGSSEMGPVFFGRIRELSSNGLGRIHPWIMTKQKNGLIGIRADDDLVAEGYTNGTAMLDQDDFYPGDRVTIKEDQAYWEGRASELINTGGDKIAPERIEAGLHNFPGISNVVALAVPNDQELDDIGLVLETENSFSQSFLEKELKRQYGAQLHFKIACVDAIPLSGTGKAERRKLRRLFE